MKPRKVVLTIETESTAPIKVLRQKDLLKLTACWEGTIEIPVLQVQANVIKKEKK